MDIALWHKYTSTPLGFQSPLAECRPEVWWGVSWDEECFLKVDVDQGKKYPKIVHKNGYSTSTTHLGCCIHGAGLLNESLTGVGASSDGLLAGSNDVVLPGPEGGAGDRGAGGQAVVHREQGAGGVMLLEKTIIFFSLDIVYASFKTTNSTQRISPDSWCVYLL